MKTISPQSRLTGVALLAAIVIVLQFLGGFIKFGPFSVTLVLVPIVIGAALFGVRAGAFLGTVFGAVVLLNCITGVDPGGNIMFTANPFLTSVLCLGKGAAAGAAAGAVYRKLSRRDKQLGIILAAVICPVINTALFLAAMGLFYREILFEWAGDTSVLYYLFIGLAGVNFLLELTFNLVLSPIIANIIRIYKYKNF